jgi:four helix bundle suffix protein
MQDPEPLIPKYGGYRKLKSYRMAQLIRDVTALFCERFLDEESRTWERMMQAAESGAQKIAEGSQAGEGSKKTELKLTTIARASLDELRLLYVGFLRQQELPLWDPEDPRRAELVARRPRTLDDVAQWAEWVQQNAPSIQSTESMPSNSGDSGSHAETLANGALVLIAMAFSVLDRQLSAQTRIVRHEANLAERLRRSRLAEWPE